jgi:hypothetical protein
LGAIGRAVRDGHVLSEPIPLSHGVWWDPDHRWTERVIQPVDANRIKAVTTPFTVDITLSTRVEEFFDGKHPTVFLDVLDVKESVVVAVASLGDVPCDVGGRVPAWLETPAWDTRVGGVESAPVDR